MKKFFVALGVSLLVVAACMDSPEQVAEKEKANIAKQEAVAAQMKAEKIKGFHCLSAWDGSHRGVEEYTKEHLRDPDSYQHIATRITPEKDGEHVLAMQYRAKNGFGGYTSGSILAKVNNDTCRATILASN